MREQSIFETSGASIALATLLDDDDNRCPAAIELIMSASAEYREEFLEVVSGMVPYRTFEYGGVSAFKRVRSRRNRIADAAIELMACFERDLHSKLYKNVGLFGRTADFSA